MKKPNKLKLKTKYLEKNVFYGLQNLNTGWDSPSIYYFSEPEFKTVLDRVEQLELGIYGIEPWDLDHHYFDTKTYEDYSENSTDPNWYNKAFNEFKEAKVKLHYAASYYVPEELLKR